MKQLTKKCLMALLTLAMTFTLFAGLNGFFAQASSTGVADNTPFYDNPFDAASPKSTVTKNEGGAYSISQLNGARLWYGDYLSGSHETVNYLNLTDLSIEMSIDNLDAGGQLTFGFLTYIPNGSYPSQGWGQGVALYLNGDGNHGFGPQVGAFASTEDANYSPITTSGNNYLVYNNSSPRTSYFGKKMTIHIFVENDLLKFYVDYAIDEVNASTTYSYRAELALASLPSAGTNAFDYTKAHMIITNSSSVGADMTIYSISDPTTNAYYNSVGGKLNNSVKPIVEFKNAINAFDLENTTNEQVQNYKTAKANFTAINYSALRHEDKVEYDAVNAINTESIDAKVAEMGTPEEPTPEQPVVPVGVADNTPFYNDPYNPNNGATIKNADGSYGIYQSTGGGGTRLFYGDYLSGSHETQYLVNLTDFTMEFSIERLAAGQTIEIGFLTPVNLGSYPMPVYGQGVSINLIDGNGAPWGHEANSDFNPIITAFNTDGVETKGSNDCPWHVYSNTSVRPSYLGKKMTLHIFVSEGVMNFDITWATDEVNNGNAVNFSGMINVDALPFDYTKAHMIITNSASDGADMTIYNISEANTNAYYSTAGGKVNNSVKAIAEYVSAVKAFDVNNVTGEQIKNYYYAKNNFDNFNTSILRNEDLVEYNTAKTLSTEGFDAVALANADKAFEGYTANSEITDYTDALKVYYYYFAFADQLSAYAEVVANIRDAIATQDFGQLAVINEMNAIMTEYAEFDASKFYIAKARYDAVTVSYNGLSMFAKDLASNKFAELNTWGATWTNAYYVTTGSYFSTVYGYNPEDGTKWENPAHASRNEDGTTTIALPDHFGYRIAYGSDVDMETGYWTDYRVNISDFSVAFSIDQIANSGRFAVNFMANRAAVSYGTETTPGLAIIFRSDWGSSGNLNVSLQSIAGKNGNNYLNIDAWTNKVPEINGYSEIGTISSGTGIYDQDVVIKFVATEDGYKLTVSIGSSTATATLSKAFMDEMFVMNNEAVDYSSLVMGFSIGEGGSAFGGGMDTVLTIKNINDDYARMVAQIKNEINVFSNTVKNLSAKEEFAIAEINSYNKNKANIYGAVAAMRTYEKAECEKLLEGITAEMLSDIDAKAIAYVSTKLEALTVTVENYNQANETLKEIADYYNVLSDEQKALYEGYAAKYEGATADVKGCADAKVVIDAIEALVAKILLPSTAEAITTERNEVAAKYQALDAKYATMVTNYAEFEAFSAELDSYDPVASVKNAIEKLVADYETVSNATLAAAKQAVADVKAAYEQLLETQKTEIDNYAKIAEVEATIAAFEQYVADYAVASSVITAIETANTTYETVTAENYDAMVAEIATLNTAYGELTEAQKALVENYALIADMQAKVDAYDVELQATTAANAVIEKINAIGEVAFTTECKAMIDEARTAYEALSEQAKAKVTNLETLTAAETAYTALENAQSSTSQSTLSSCMGSISTSAMMAVVTLLAGAFAMFTKKKD